MKRLLLILVIILIGMQFIQPEENKASGPFPNRITNKYAMPDSIEGIMKTACYDCHSNNTVYPWYAKVQPVTWWLNNHVVEGKEHLNFDEFLGYSLRKQYHKLEETEEMVQEGHMPLDSYLWLHDDARLNEQQKKAIITWSESVRKQMEAKYPIDSLKKK